MDEALILVQRILLAWLSYYNVTGNAEETWAIELVLLCIPEDTSSLLSTFVRRHLWNLLTLIREEVEWTSAYITVMTDVAEALDLESNEDFDMDDFRDGLFNELPRLPPRHSVEYLDGVGIVQNESYEEELLR